MTWVNSWTKGSKVHWSWNRTQRNEWVSFSSILLIIILCMNIWGCDSSNKYFKGSTMGTFYNITYRGNIGPNKLKPIVDRHLSEIESQLSNWDQESWISRFNSSRSTEFVRIPQHAHQVMTSILDLSDQTGPVLDPTLGRLINLWGFGPDEVELPPDNQDIQTAIKTTGIAKITLKDDPPRIAKTTPDLKLNLSAMAKGYSADVLAKKIERMGIMNYVVNIGGEMHISGSPSRGSHWRISIQQPSSKARDSKAHASMDLRNTGFATSGDYRRFFEDGGDHYSHIIDPRTGRPTTSNLASVSIMAPTTMQADGLATACLVLGLKKSFELVSRLTDVEGFFIQRVTQDKFRITHTTGWPSTRKEKSEARNYE